MKIISNNNLKKMVATIHCNCGTSFEFEAADMFMKGNYAYSYHVNCPTCNDSHNYTENMTAENESEVQNYISSCRSCLQCKYLAEIQEGYSSYTITNISIHCKMNKNPHMPLGGYEDRSEKESVYALAEKCHNFKKGIRYIKEVEESEGNAFERWEKANNNYSDY